MNPEDAITVESVYKSFADHHVLKDVSIEVPSGKIFGVIGLNGIGKTTLMKIILDLFRADSGRTYIFGQRSIFPISRKMLAYMPEKFIPSPNLTAKEFLELSLSFYGMPYRPEDAKLIAKQLDLDPDVLGNPLGKYSKGMGQKVGLLATFLADRPLLMLDEPMSGLDPRAKIFLKERMKQARDEGKTIFFSSHILSDIEELCDQMAVLHQGEVLYKGSPESFRKQHKGKNLEDAFLNILKPEIAAS